MSSALVRQALALVDPEESGVRRRGAARRRPEGQGSSHPYKRKSKKQIHPKSKSERDITEENVQKLLALSQPTADAAVAEKLVARAVKRKPLLDKIEVKTDEPKSILFADEETESFEKFEEEYFCS